ncbi:Epoxide hydrolase 4 [Geodia barretti]|uniref:Epoxide hydrolase 4 n=1 Tax=Geodia barretti TaxID=519541 RepID=A0AA35TWC0_GEOBA|nr:Epoxide hydrolase 4 [Geodia barretti]
MFYGRGYGETDKPPNKLDYRIELLVQDIAELIPALGHSSCVLCAHDWGGGVAWFVAMKYPELVDRLIIMNCPHFKVFQQNLQRNCGQLCKSWYMFLFQVPKVPEFLLSMSDYSAIRNTFTGAQQGVRNRASFPPEVVEAYKYTFSQPGALTAPINYYRCLHEARDDMKPYLNRKINMPTMIIWGDCDKFLSCEMADQHDMVCSDLTVK